MGTIVGLVPLVVLDVMQFTALLRPFVGVGAPGEDGTGR